MQNETGNVTEPARSVMSRIRQVHYESLFDKQDEFYSYKLISLHAAITEVTLPGDYAEFGVYKGRCARFLLPFVIGKRKLHLFDSFEGLPEDWLGMWKKGTFSLSESEIPAFDGKKVTVNKGWFEDTLPEFAKTLVQPLAFLHIDSDLYSSAMDVFQSLNDHIAPGTILLFDEYTMEHGDQRDEGEHEALWDWSRLYNRRFEYLWRTKWVQVAVRVTV